MSGKITKTELARQLKLTESRVYEIFREGTTHQGQAEKIARLYGGTAEQYYRDPRPKGRKRDLVGLMMRLGEYYTFREFVSEETIAAEEVGALDACDSLISRLDLEYLAHGNRKPPDDFETLESLLGYMRKEGFSLEQRDLAPLMWNRFKCWRIDQVAMEAKFDVEDGDF